MLWKTSLGISCELKSILKVGRSVKDNFIFIEQADYYQAPANQELIQGVGFLSMAIVHLPNFKAQGKTKNVGKRERYLQTKLTKSSNLLVKQFL